jgi:hypothetical protein
MDEPKTKHTTPCLVNTTSKTCQTSSFLHRGCQNEMLPIQSVAGGRDVILTPAVPLNRSAVVSFSQMHARKRQVIEFCRVNLYGQDF